MAEVFDREFTAGGQAAEVLNVAPIVCIGVSAGGVAPLQELFRRLRPDTEMVFVVIHQLRHVPTLLPDILADCTTMPIQLACSNMELRPNRVYVLPSGNEMVVQGECFSVKRRAPLTERANVSTVFLRSLLRSYRHPGIAVVLSGRDEDGPAALKEFSERGGITIVQAPCTAAHPEMPVAAIASGCADFVLPPAAIAGQLEQLAEAFESCCCHS